jgi:hypothetical protein
MHAHLFLVHGRDDGDENILAVIECALDLLADITLGDLDIVLGGTVVGHEVKETLVDVDLYLKQVRTSHIGKCGKASAGRGGVKRLTSWYSSRRTLGTSMLWVEGEISSCEEMRNWLPLTWFMDLMTDHLLAGEDLNKEGSNERESKGKRSRIHTSIAPRWTLA